MQRSALLLVLLPLACSEAREREARGDCVSYVEDVAPRLRQYCSTCHAEDRAEGDYVTATYGAVLQGGSDDVPNAIAGDEESRILQVLATAERHHLEATAIAGLLREWVVECELAHRDSLVHEPGILDPASDAFHGASLAGTGDVYAPCRDCHGDRLRGGGTEVSCRTCHRPDATDCSVCHRPEKVDAPHARHAAFDCESCHAVPERYDAPGHLDGTADVRIVAFGLDGAFDTSAKTCEAYCHGEQRPAWGPGEDAPCGTCHGNPPTSHAFDDCARCHDTATHVNGAVEVFEDCDACHVPAETGKHREHLSPRLGLTSSMQCSDCHLVPETVTAPGHLDTPAPAEVFVEAILGESLAAARGASPTYDGATCSNVYCHGDATLSWAPSTEHVVFCGTCHGLPPETSPHESSMTIRTCVDCHASSVDGFGNIIFVDGESEHLDGEVDR